LIRSGNLDTLLFPSFHYFQEISSFFQFWDSCPEFDLLIRFAKTCCEKTPIGEIDYFEVETSMRVDVKVIREIISM
jgi:hypothetical protein